MNFSFNDPAFVTIFWIVLALIVAGFSALHAAVYLAYLLPITAGSLRRTRTRLAPIIFTMIAAGALATPAAAWGESHEQSPIWDLAAILISLSTAAHIAWATRQWVLATGPVLAWALAAMPLHAGHFLAAIIIWHGAALAITLLWRLTCTPEPAPPIPPQSTLPAPASSCPSPSPPSRSPR